MTSFFIAPIVEGHGEIQAVPILLQRILQAARNDAQLLVNPPLRVKAGSFIHDGDYFAKYLELASRKAKSRPNGSVLILLDSEDHCPAKLGSSITERACALHNDVPIVVALAYREYETWFLAAARSLRGLAGLPHDLEPPSNPEKIRNAKGWLSDRMSVSYNEPIHQDLFTRNFEFDAANAVSSFSRLKSKLDSLFSI